MIPESAAVATGPRLPNWQAVAAVQREERRRDLPLTDTGAAVQAFEGAWQAVRAARLPPRSSGLVEQQRLFARLRKA